MNDADKTNRSSHLGSAALLTLGMIFGGWILGAQIKATRLSDRYVEVRGLAERKVKSDLAIWQLNYTEAGDDLTALYAKTDSDRKTIQDFLSQQGVQAGEVELGIVRVTDTQANPYGGDSHPAHRYIVAQQITVRTGRVDQVAAAAQKTIQLLQRGVVLSGDFGGGLAYKFTALNSIKPDMITEATRNAHAAAERFAQDSGSRVGAIRQATQGVFSITAADDVGGAAGGANYGAPGTESSLMKNVRVVTSVQYFLDK